MGGDISKRYRLLKRLRMQEVYLAVLNLKNFDYPSFLLGMVTALNILLAAATLGSRWVLLRLTLQAKEDADRITQEAKDTQPKWKRG